MAATETYDVTPLVGNQPEHLPRVEELVAVIYKTVMPAGWLKMGGLGTIRPFYNQVNKKWYLAVFSDVPRAEMDAFLTKLAQ